MDLEIGTPDAQVRQLSSSLELPPGIPVLTVASLLSLKGIIGIIRIIRNIARYG